MEMLRCVIFLKNRGKMGNKKQINKIKNNAELAWAAYGKTEN